MTTTNAQPKILDRPIGLDATGTRREFDSLGDVDVPANRYWGAQTQRSLEHFNIGRDRMPEEVYHAYGYVKKAAALENTRAGRLSAWKGRLIGRVCDEVISGALDQDFPLFVWQTGSGTQSNMNVNEVISNRCIQLVGGTLGSQQPVHPNDHVNNYLHSALIMADMCDHFREFMVEGTTLNQAKLTDNIDRSVMMVTALSPIIGYDQAAVISYYAIDHDLTLKQAALANGVSEDLFDRVVDPLALTRGGSADLPAPPNPAPPKPTPPNPTIPRQA
jgi:fumarate hydratase class II